MGRVRWPSYCPLPSAFSVRGRPFFLLLSLWSAKKKKKEKTDREETKSIPSKRLKGYGPCSSTPWEMNQIFFDNTNSAILVRVLLSPHHLPLSLV